MNKQLYKIIFSKRLGTLVAVGEHATSASKAASGQGCRGTVVADGFVGALRFTFASVVLACLSLGTQAQSSVVALASTALPQGGNVSTGSAAISTSGANMAITQSTDKASINWQSFNVGSAASVSITQPSTNAVLLNRIVGNDPSQILGKLTANGQLILLNPNGVVFGKDGSVTASSFTASTFGLTDADFMTGYYKYKRNGSTAAVVNQGTIETTAGGFVALIGATVTNEGTIRAPQGDVVLAAAESVTLPSDLAKPQTPASPNSVSVRMSKRVRLELDPSAVNTAVNNTESGVIVTEGGQVLLQSAALSSAVASVTHSGRIDTSAPQAGAVTILADNGVIKVDGSIATNSIGTDSQGQARKGADIVIGRDLETGVLANFTDVSSAKLQSNQGLVETSGNVLATTGARVKAGEWLLDPYNITIASGAVTGTNYSNYTSGADSTILASDISANLSAGTSVTLATGAGGASAGNIAVNENISKTGGGDATLTLQAHGNISVAVNKTITSNTGKLNVVFNSDSDNSNGGGIVFNTGSGITSNGGNITLGGGTALNGTGYAMADGSTTTHGISIDTATINAGGGNIAMNGKSAVTNSNTGIYMSGGTISTSGGGSITLVGNNQDTDRITTGFFFASGTITGGAGGVSITGDSRGVTSSTYQYIRGAIINGTVTSTGGNINITGYGGTGVQYDYGVDIGGSVNATGTGAINITGTAAAGVSGGNVGVTTSGSGTISSVDGAINITGTGGVGMGGAIRDHGVFIGGSNAVQSTGAGNITVTGTATNPDTAYSQGVAISTGGLNTNSGNIKIDGTAVASSQGADYINAPVTSTSGNVYIRSSGAGIQNTATGTITGKNVSIDNSNGTVDTNTGAITTSTGTAGSATGMSIGGNITATGNLNLYGISSSNIGINLASGKNLSGANIQAVGKTANGTYGIVLNGSNTVTTTGTSGDSLVKGMTTGGGTNALLAGGGLTLTSANGTTLTLWGDGKSTGDRGARFDGGVTTNGAVTLQGSSNNATALMIINGAVTANANSSLSLSGSTSASNQSAVYFVNGGGVALKNAATLNINGQNTTSSGAGTGVLIQGAGISRSTGTSGAVTITGTVANGTAGSTGVSVQAGVSTDGNIDIQGNVASTASTGVSITSAGGVTSSGSATTVNIGSNYGIANAGSVKVSGSTGTGSNINFTSTNSGIAGAGAIGDTTNKNASITFTQAGTSTYDGAINARNFTKAGIGALTLDSWAYTTPALTNVSNAYTVNNGGSLTLNTGSSYYSINPVSVNINNASTFSTGIGNGIYENTTYTFDSGGGGTLVFSGNPVTSLAAAGTKSSTIVTNGGATNLVTQTINMNAQTLNLNVAAGTSGTTIQGGGYAGLMFTSPNGSGVGIQNGNVINKTGPGTVVFNDTTSFNSLNITNGGIQVGNGSTTGALGTGTVAISSGASLVFNRSNSYTSSSVFTGSGNLVQAGAGAVTLTGNSNAFAGATTVNAGKSLIIGTSGSLGAVGSTLTLSDSTSNLSFTNTSGTSTVGSSISGAGTVTENGAGGVGVLLGNNTYIGTTTVSAGTLQIGNGGATGTLGSGSVINNAALVFNRDASSDLTVSNVISGTGTLTQAGVGKSILSAANTYTGVTNISAGTLSLTTPSSSYLLPTALSNQYATSQFNISSGATLDFNIPTNATESSNAASTTFSGAGTITKTGGGKLTWGSYATFAMSPGSLIDVQAGTFVGGWNNSLTWTNNKSSLNVASGATFNGVEAGVNVDALTGAGTVNTGYSATQGSITVGVANEVAGTYNAAGSATFSGTINATGTGTGSGLSKVGTGTQILTGSNGYLATSISGGTLQVGSGGSTGSLGSGAVTLSNGANLVFSRNVSTDINNTISGNGNVTANITGAGSDLNLTSNITLSGATGVQTNNAILSTTGSITQAAGMSIGAKNLYMTASGGSIGASGQRINTSVDNLSLNSAGNQYVTEADSVTVASQTTANGSVDILTTGALTVDSVNSINGVTANGSGGVTLTGGSNSLTSSGVTLSESVSAGGDISIDGKSGTAFGVWIKASKGVYTTNSVGSPSTVSIKGASAGNTAVAVIGEVQTINGSTLRIEGTGTNGAKGIYGELTTFGNNFGKIGSATSGAVTLIGTSSGGIDNALGTDAMLNGGYGVLIRGDVTSQGKISITGTSDYQPGVFLQHSTYDYNRDMSEIQPTIQVVSGGAPIAGDAIYIQGTNLLGGTVNKNGVLIGSKIINSSNGGATTIFSDKGGVALLTSTTTKAGVTTTGSGSLQNDASAGAVNITAGTDANSTASIGDVLANIPIGNNVQSAWTISAAGTNITQNSNAGVNLKTTGQGNLTVPKITNNGTGDIVVAAGTSISAGTGSGGQILTAAGNTLTQANATPGHTYVYSGTPSNTGVLSNLSTSFNSLYYEGTNQALNTGFNTAFDGNHADDLSAPAGGSVGNTQVFFRSNTKPSFTLAITAPTKTYGDADPALTSTSGATLTNAYAGVGGINTFAVTTADVIAGLSRTAGENVGSYAYGWTGSNFNTTVVGGLPSLVINKRDITLSTLVASNRAYDGTTNATITSATFVNLANGEALGLSGSGEFDTKNFGNGKTVTVADVTTLNKSNGTGDWGNYNLTTTGSKSKTTTANIAKAALNVTATQVTKEYDGLTSATGVGTVSAIAGALAGEVINSSGVQVFTNPNAGSGNKTVQASGVSIKDALNNDVTANYNINYVNNTTSTITPAPLTIKVNNTAMFVTQDARTAADQGFSYTGFKNGETEANALTGGGLTVAARTYTGASNFPTAGSYSGVYSATAPSSVNGNYAITMQTGNLTVVPADKLLINITSQNDTYGNRTASNAGYVGGNNVTAQYCFDASNCSGANLVNLTTTQLTGNQWKAADNTGSYVVFDTTLLTPAYSTGGFLKVGNYTFSSTEISPLSLPNGNFTGRFTNGGALTIAPIAASLSATGIAKTYDGTTGVSGVSITPNNLASGDVVSATTGTGSFASKDAANGIGLTLSNLSLSGADASNYYLASNSLIVTGDITPKAITLTGTSVANKLYDGNTSASITSAGNLSGLIGNETLTLNGLTGSFNSPAVGTHKPVAIAATLQNGTNGGLASNYTLGASTAYADITQANSDQGGYNNISPIVVPPKPIIPTDSPASSGGESGGGSYSANPYLVIPSNRPSNADRCTPNSLEDCLCETQEPRPLEGLAICYQPKKTASTTPAKGRRG